MVISTLQSKVKGLKKKKKSIEKGYVTGGNLKHLLFCLNLYVANETYFFSGILLFIHTMAI